MSSPLRPPSLRRSGRFGAKSASALSARPAPRPPPAYRPGSSGGGGGGACARRRRSRRLRSDCASRRRGESDQRKAAMTSETTAELFISDSRVEPFVLVTSYVDTPPVRRPAPECPAPRAPRAAARTCTRPPRRCARTNAIEPCRIGFSRARSWMRAFGYSCSTTRCVLATSSVQQLARRELVIEPVDGAVLQVRERIVPRRARQLVLAEHDLLLPRVELIGRVRATACRRSSRRARIVWPP